MSPMHAAYDVVIIGGAIMGSSAAWFLTNNADFNGRVLVVERDPSYAQASTHPYKFLHAPAILDRAEYSYFPVCSRFREEFSQLYGG